MRFFYIFIVSFIIFYLLYLFFVILNNKKKNKIFDTKQASIFINLNKLDISKVDKGWFVQCLSISNSLILSFTFTFTFVLSEFFKSYILILFISFIVLFLLIIVVYKIAGAFLRRNR